MDDNEIYEEQLMDSNRKRMKELDKVFSAAFYICAAYPAFKLVIDLIAVGVALVTLGVYAVNPLSVIVKFIAHIAMLAAFLWSYFKDRIGTIASIAVIILWWAVCWSSWNGDLIVLGASLLWLGMQILCLTKYKELERLKCEPGYPDFNGIFLHNNSSRIATDLQIRKQIRENKGSVMDELNTDGSTLADKNADRFENHYMEGISADDISASDHDKRQQ